MQIRHAGAMRNFCFQIKEGKLQVWVYQKGLEQADSIGTGTASDADWACRGDAKNVHFFQIEEGKLQAWVYTKSFD